jgi:hypothetical protein
MNFTSKLKNRLIKVANTVSDNLEFVDSNQSDARMNICLSCPHLSSKIYQCDKCGCFMKAKTKLKNVSCPIGKW